MCPSRNSHYGQRDEIDCSGYLLLWNKSLQNLGTKTTVISLFSWFLWVRHLGKVSWVTLAWGPLWTCSQIYQKLEHWVGDRGSWCWELAEHTSLLAWSWGLSSGPFWVSPHHGALRMVRLLMHQFPRKINKHQCPRKIRCLSFLWPGVRNHIVSLHPTLIETQKPSQV